jgi:hypothetical protein
MSTSAGGLRIVRQRRCRDSQRRLDNCVWRRDIFDRTDACNAQGTMWTDGEYNVGTDSSCLTGGGGDV